MPQAAALPAGIRERFAFEFVKRLNRPATELGSVFPEKTACR